VSALQTTTTLRLQRYAPADQGAWDDFVARAKNGVFLFHRGYMDYHADRFADHSLMAYQGDRLIALLPANQHDDSLITHGGLTFGGFVTDGRMRTATMLELFDRLRDHAAEHGLRRLIYKPVPHIYYKSPAEEDLYALFRHNAKLIRRDVSSTVCLAERLALTKGRKWGISRARAAGLDVRRSDAIAAFIEMERARLAEKYGVSPTHTAAEMQLLADRFPYHIKLFAAFQNDALLAGVLVYESARVAHAQYIASSPEGRDVAALDAVLDYLLTREYADKPFFDFGISTEDGGRHLNLGLIDNKESYGARATVYDWYELGLNN
jgi:hypothetical protein